MTEYLLKQKADIKARDSNKKRTPLHLAARYGDYKYSYFIEKIE